MLIPSIVTCLPVDQDSVISGKNCKETIQQLFTFEINVSYLKDTEHPLRIQTVRQWSMNFCQKFQLQYLRPAAQFCHFVIDTKASEMPFKPFLLCARFCH